MIRVGGEDIVSAVQLQATCKVTQSRILIDGDHNYAHARVHIELGT